MKDGILPFTPGNVRLVYALSAAFAAVLTEAGRYLYANDPQRQIERNVALRIRHTHSQRVRVR